MVKLVSSLFLIFSLSGCAVYKAASNEGVAVSDILGCKTKTCFLSQGMEAIEKNEDKSGKYIVTYRSVARKSGANYIRAAGHGVLDVMTLGIWEAVGTPIEGSLSSNRGYVVAKAVYPHKDANVIESAQIYDVDGKLVLTDSE